MRKGEEQRRIVTMGKDKEGTTGKSMVKYLVLEDAEFDIMRGFAPLSGIKLDFELGTSQMNQKSERNCKTRLVSSATPEVVERGVADLGRRRRSSRVDSWSIAGVRQA